MANNYMQTSTQYPIAPGNTQRAEEILDELGKKWAEAEDFGEESYCGFQYEFEDGGVWMYDEEYANIDQIAEFIARCQVEFGATEHFAFSYCYSCSKMRIDEFGGGCVVVMPDGELLYSGNEHSIVARHTPFTLEERNILFEAARIALASADGFNRVVDACDMKDKDMIELIEKLEKFMSYRARKQETT